MMLDTRQLAYSFAQAIRCGCDVRALAEFWGMTDDEVRSVMENACPSFAPRARLRLVTTQQ